MKKTYLVLALAVVLVFAFATTATAKYAGFAANEQYLSWGGAQTINSSIVNTEGETTMTATPHGGYTQTSVKCVICHSIHRAWTTATTMESSSDFALLNNGADGTCVQCHAAWGASPSDSLVAVAESGAGPHGSSCDEGCHGSVHGMGQNTKYAVVAKYNLANPRIASSTLTDTVLSGFWTEGGSTSDNITYYMDAAIAKGNTNAQISESATGDAMKAFATGYVCTPCHGNSSFTVATPGFANMIDIDGGVSPASGHPSANAQFYGHAPTCEKCHDVVDVATNSTAWPHSNRGIDVYADRFSYNAQGVGEAYDSGDVSDLIFGGSTIIATDNGDATRYGLFMTSGESDSTSEAIGPITPIQRGPSAGRGEGGGFSLRDGSCLKCHVTDGSEHSLP